MIMRKHLLFLVTLLVTLSTAFAAGADLSVFRETYSPQLPTLQLPQVVKTVLPVQDFEIAIIENATAIAQPWKRIRKTERNTVQTAITETSVLIGDPDSITDGDSKTSAEFDLDADGGQASVIFEAVPTLTSSQLKIVLARNVALPHEIEISAWVGGKWKTVLARSRMNNVVVNFPENSSEKWRVKFWYAQPLRVVELQLVDVNSRSFEIGEEYIWLARPGETYSIYARAAARGQISVGELGSLLADQKSILEVSAGVVRQNAGFKEPDSDSDGVADIRDNCVALANSNQADLDTNGRGDACEDHDQDGVMDDKDNCPAHANRNQKDIDADGIGDVCDDSESRVTEKFPWLPWAAMGLVAIVIGFIIMKTIQDAQKNKAEDSDSLES